MKPVVFDEAARDEYREAIRYYHHIDPELRTGFRAEFRDLIAAIQSNPLLFNIRKHGARRANLKRFSLYYIAYMLWKGGRHRGCRPCEQATLLLAAAAQGLSRFSLKPRWQKNCVLPFVLSASECFKKLSSVPSWSRALSPRLRRCRFATM